MIIFCTLAGYISHFPSHPQQILNINCSTRQHFPFTIQIHVTQNLCHDSSMLNVRTAIVLSSTSRAIRTLRSSTTHHPPLHPPPSQYIHPLSNEVLKVLQSRPEFLAKHDLTRLSVLKDGSISVTSNSITSKMNIFTTYESDKRIHYLRVVSGDDACEKAKIVLMNNNQQPWQTDQQGLAQRVETAVLNLVVAIEKHDNRPN